MPSLADLEQWIEEQIPQEIHDLPFKIQSILRTYHAQLVEQVDQIVRLGPSLAREIESSLPANPFKTVDQIPIPSQSTNNEKRFSSFIDHIASQIDTYTGSRRNTSIVSGIAFVGLTYAIVKRTQTISERRRIAFENDPSIPPRVRNGNRIDAVILLGVEGHFGQSLAHSFTSRGFIVLASVPSEEDKQSFDALVPPSMRGYIKTIVLPNVETQSEHISNFVRTISTAQQLRWPLTAAGDPYARQGRELNIVAIINASSYISPFENVAASNSFDKKGTSSMFEVQTLSNELQKRVIAPLAVTRALLRSIKPSHQHEETQSTSFKHSTSTAGHVIVLSLIRPKGESDIISQSIKAGTHALHLERENVNVSCLVLEAREPSIKNLFLSVWPNLLGSNAIRTDHEIASSKQPWSNDLKSSQTSIPVKKLRQEENRMIGEAAITLLRTTFSNQRNVWHKTFFVRLKNTAYSDQLLSQQEGFTNERSQFPLETTTFLRIFQTVFSPIAYSLSSLYHRIGLPLVKRILPSAHHRGICYSGTSNPSNVRPAFGPGPGPASNTHSRSCIRPNDGNGSTAGSSDSTKGTNNVKSKKARPMSTVSNSSSDHARSSESDTGSGGGLSSNGTNGARDSIATGSAPVSAPPSTHDMSSSGLLSSVPSSAFGDEDGVESDYLHHESPIPTHTGGMNEDGGFDASHLRASSSTSLSHDGSWHHTSFQSRQQLQEDEDDQPDQLRHSQSSSALSDDQADDSGTALGARTRDTNQSKQEDDDVLSMRTPSASQHQAGSQESDSTISNVISNSPPPPPPPQQQQSHMPGTQSPLGQSWVALGQSSTEDHQQP